MSKDRAGGEGVFVCQSERPDKKGRLQGSILRRKERCIYEKNLAMLPKMKTENIQK